MRTTRCAGAAALVACAVLAGCGGGGGGGGPSTGLSVSTTELGFTAAADASTPASQIVSGTITGVTESIRIDIVVTGDAVQGATFNLLGDNSGALTISVRPPDMAGVGSHKSQIQVFACTNLRSCTNGAPQIPGSPRTITVSYDVTAASPTVHYVAPHVAQAGHSTDVIIRGAGFAQLTRPTVSAGGTPALSTTFISDTEVRATIPAMAAGSYPIQLRSSASNGVAATTQATLRVLAEPALGYTFIADSGSKTRVIFDAPRSALYVGNTSTGQLTRYAHIPTAANRAPVWTATALPIPAPTDIAMLPDGNTLLVTSERSVVHIDLDAFAVTRKILVEPIPVVYGLRPCVANNGVVYLVPSREYGGGGGGRLYRYNSRFGTVTTEDGSIQLVGPTCTAAGNGSKVFIATNFDQRVLQYDATTNAALALSTVRASAFTAQADATGDTLLFGRTIFRGSVALGMLPDSNAHIGLYASILTADGRTAYAYQPALRSLDVYDITAPSSGGFGAKPPVALSGPYSAGTNSTLTMGLTPFGGTLFIVGSDGILVQPLPAES